MAELSDRVLSYFGAFSLSFFRSSVTHFPMASLSTADEHFFKISCTAGLYLTGADFLAGLGSIFFGQGNAFLKD